MSPLLLKILSVATSVGCFVGAAYLPEQYSTALTTAGFSLLALAGVTQARELKGPKK